MKNTHLKKRAIALAVGLAISSLATAQTTSDIDTTDPDQVLLGTTAVDNIENGQVLIGNVNASTDAPINVGVTLVDGVSGVTNVEALNNSVEVAASANAVTTNLIDIPTGTISADAEIASAQLSQGDISALVDDNVLIGAELNGVLGSLDLDVNSSDISASASANKVENRIEGDQSASTGAANGSAANLAIVDIPADTSVEAEVGAGSDLSIASTQLADGSIQAGLSDDSSTLIGVSLSDNDVQTESSGDLDVSVVDSDVDVDASGNDVLNQIDVEAGGAISRNIATAQSLTGDTVNAFVNNLNVGVEVNASSADALNLGSSANVSVNSTDVTAGASGNSARSLVVVDLNAAGSNQSIVSTQAVNLENGINSSIDNVNVGIEVPFSRPSGDIFDAAVDAEVLNTNIAASSTGNSSDNLLASQSIATGSTSFIEDSQDIVNSDITSSVSNVAVGVESPNDISETDLDVISTSVSASASGNLASNRIQLEEIGDGSNNEIELQQGFDTNATVSASIDDVNVGVDINGQLGRLGDAVDGTVVGNDISIADTSLQSNAQFNGASNAIVIGSVADDSFNQVSSEQTADQTAASVSNIQVGVEVSSSNNQDSALDLAVNATDIGASAIGTNADNDITLLGTGSGSVNAIQNSQATNGITSAEVGVTGDVSIGLRFRDSANNGFTFTEAVDVEISDANVAASATGSRADNRIAIAENAADSLNTIISDQSQGADVTAQASDVSIGIQALGERDINIESADGVSLNISASSVVSDATANTINNQVLLTGLGNNSTNVVLNQQDLDEGNVTAETSNVEIGLEASSTDFVVGDAALGGGLSVNTESNQVSSQAQANLAVNSVNALSSLEDSQTAVLNFQQVGANGDVTVSATTENVVIGALVSNTSTSLLDSSSVISSNNDVTSVANVNTAINSITAADGSVEESTNLLGNLQLATNTDASSLIDNVEVSLFLNSSDAVVDGALDVAANSNVMASSTGVNTASNSVVLEGIANDTNNVIVNAQSLSSGSVTSAISNSGAGFISAGDSLDLADGDLSVTAVNNQLSSEARVNSASNSFSASNSLVDSLNVVGNIQAVGIDGVDGGALGDLVSDLGSLNFDDIVVDQESITDLLQLGDQVVVSSNVDEVGFGALLRDGTTNVNGDLNITVNSNDVSAATIVNAASNSIEAQGGSAEDSTNIVINAQAANVIASSNAANTQLGVDIDNADTATIAGDANVSVNNNEVSSLTTINTASNSIRIEGIADDTNNVIVNAQTVLGEVTAVTGLEGGSDIVNIGLISRDAGDIQGSVLVTANSNEVSSVANGNVAVNTIFNDISASDSVNNITSVQANIATGAGTNALTNATTIGANIDVVDATGGLTVIANSNDISATSSFNAVNNIIQIDSLGNGSDNDINNLQSVDLSGADAVIDTRVSGIAIGAVIADSTPTADINATVLNNDITSSVTGNSALNAIRVDNLIASDGSDILNSQGLIGNGNILSSTISSADIGVTFDASVGSVLNLDASVNGNDIFSSAIGNTAVNNISLAQLGGAGASISNTQFTSGVSIQATLGSEFGGINVGVSSRGNDLGGFGGDISVSANNNRISATAVGNSAVNRIGGIGGQ